MQHEQTEGEHLGGLHQRQHREAEHVAQHDLRPTQRTRHQALEGSLAALAEECHRGDDEDEEEDDQPDEGGAEIVERVEAQPTVEEGDPGIELNAAGLAGEGDERLTDGLHDARREARLASLEVNLRRDDPMLLCLHREVGRQHHVPGNVAGPKPGFRVSLGHWGGGNGFRIRQCRGDHAAEAAAVEVYDAHLRHVATAAKQVTEESKDDERGTEQKRERATVPPKLVQESLRDRPDATRAHAGEASESLRKASSKRSTPAFALISATVPSASSLPKRINPRRSHRSASSMTWLETTMEVPAAAILRKPSHS